VYFRDTDKFGLRELRQVFIIDPKIVGVKYGFLKRPIVLPRFNAFRVKLEPAWFVTKNPRQGTTELLDSRNPLVKVRVGWQIRAFSFTLFFSVIVFLILGLITAANNSVSRDQSNTELARVNELSRVALQAKSLSAELNAWQTAYAFEITRGSQKALLDSSPARMKFLSSSRALSQQLSALELRAEVLSVLEREQLGSARRRFQEFIALDEKIIGLYRTGSAKLTQQASNLVLNSEIDLFRVLNLSITTLAENIATRAETEAIQRQRTDQVLFTRLLWFFGFALAGILMFSMIAWSFWQQRAKLMQQLSELARTDSLTNLTNRRAWNEEFPQRLERAKRNQQPMTVAMIDLDHFKRFNDTRGHLEGDAFLREMGSALRGSFRVNDFIARYGGEEFVVAFENCDLEQAQVLLARLSTVIPYAQTFSAGITQTDGSEMPEVVLDRADKAMYAAKQNGRNQVFVSLNNITLTLEPNQIILEP
jgi:diguanylate cyclase (GGDEF)-like protein